MYGPTGVTLNAPAIVMAEAYNKFISSMVIFLFSDGFFVTVATVYQTLTLRVLFL